MRDFHALCLLWVWLFLWNTVQPLEGRPFSINYRDKTVFAVSEHGTCTCQSLNTAGNLTAGTGAFTGNLILTGGALTVAPTASATFRGAVSANRLSVSGISSFNASVSIAGGTLTVGGTANLNGAVNIAGLATFNLGVAVTGGGLTVSNVANLNGPVNIGGLAAFNAGASFAGASVSVSSTANLNGAVDVRGALSAHSSASFNGGVAVNSGNFTVSAAVPTTFNGNLVVNGIPQFAGGFKSAGAQVQRDFYQWNVRVSAPVRPACVQMKTNIPVCIPNVATMYRFLIEGYNYGIAHAINSEVVGYAYGVECAIFSGKTYDHSPGAVASQYKSSDGVVVLKLNLTTAYFTGLSVSVWQVNGMVVNPAVAITSAVFPSCVNI